MNKRIILFVLFLVCTTPVEAHRRCSENIPGDFNRDCTVTAHEQLRYDRYIKKVTDWYDHGQKGPKPHDITPYRSPERV